MKRFISIAFIVAMMLCVSYGTDAITTKTDGLVFTEMFDNPQINTIEVSTDISEMSGYVFSNISTSINYAGDLAEKPDYFSNIDPSVILILQKNFRKNGDLSYSNGIKQHYWHTTKKC